MASLEEFRKILHGGNVKAAFQDYELDFNSEAFDVFGKELVQGYEVDIVWGFQEPNLIKMQKKTDGNDGSAKKIFYLPWASRGATSVTLDENSPPYFVTSHFSNCRFTMKFHDDQGKKVTVLHVAGDTKGESTVKGSQERDVIESTVDVPNVARTRRLSVAGAKALGRLGRAHMQERQIKAGTTYYDTYARVFGVRGDSGKWSFYAQSINHEGVILGFFKV